MLVLFYTFYTFYTFLIRMFFYCRSAFLIFSNTRDGQDPDLDVDECWCIDLTVDYPLDSNGFRHVLAVVDVASGYMWLRALRQKSADDVCVALQHILRGTIGRKPRRIHSDNGGEFVNMKMKDLYARLGIEESHSMPYRPNQNGVVESTHAKSKKLLKDTLAEHQHLKSVENSWSDFLWQIEAQRNDRPARRFGMHYSPLNVYWHLQYDRENSRNVKMNAQQVKDMHERLPILVSDYHAQVDRAKLARVEKLNAHQTTLPGGNRLLAGGFALMRSARRQNSKYINGSAASYLVPVEVLEISAGNIANIRLLAAGYSESEVVKTELRVSVELLKPCLRETAMQATEARRLFKIGPFAAGLADAEADRDGVPVIDADADVLDEESMEIISLSLSQSDNSADAEDSTLDKEMSGPDVATSRSSASSSSNMSPNSSSTSSSSSSASPGSPSSSNSSSAGPRTTGPRAGQKRRNDSVEPMGPGWKKLNIGELRAARPSRTIEHQDRRVIRPMKGRAADASVHRYVMSAEPTPLDSRTRFAARMKHKREEEWGKEQEEEEEEE